MVTVVTLALAGMPVKRAHDYLYAETLERIRGKIHRGEFLPGDRLPSIAEIQHNFNVGRNTAIRVINELQLEGLAAKRRKGTFSGRSLPPPFNVPPACPAAIRRFVLPKSPAVMNSLFPADFGIGHGAGCLAEDGF